MREHTVVVDIVDVKIVFTNCRHILTRVAMDKEVSVGKQRELHWTDLERLVIARCQSTLFRDWQEM